MKGRESSPMVVEQGLTTSSEEGPEVGVGQSGG